MNAEKRGKNICGKRIAQLRKEYNKSTNKPKLAQEDMVAALKEYGINMVQSSYSDLEAGCRNIKDYELIALIKILGIDNLHWLLFGEKAKK